ncbi:3-phenylpropionate/trans-cinnamate dioxygenase ferredoxin subunit [Povalibacter uvarum]|uniref:3-phenylpropionate/trans-cinnamate dioxygenase ferredoxin subunit n=1 Tax=Povalibacter uvarum TaxID=732238 RepID=A0A841HG14_9GAMM|nr:non-heme iron oxygenase ferredoxin subunit [Povalibacter uvarum]MBB6091514.1 3-phenylpropionate/trans-cinnamate dioxygenase ferredoxin subunit [Povalibacter uvarum]
MTWIAVAPAVSVVPGDYAQVEIDGALVAVFNVAGKFYAIDDVCTHDGGELAGGAVEEDVVICPRHGARFCLRTGAALTPPAYEPVRTYETRVVDGVVEVRSLD